MSVRIKTDQLIDYLGFTAQLAVTKATLYGAKIDDKVAKSFEPYLKSVYDGVKKTSGDKEITSSDLQKAFEAAGAAAIKSIAGVGRSATYVSEAEAEKLPAPLAQMYRSLKATRQRVANEKAALFEPFPQGKVDTHLFFGRYLGMVEARAADEIMGESKILDRLPALFAAAKNGPVQLGDAVVLANKDGSDVKVDGKSLYNYGGGTKLVVRTGDQAIAIGWEQGYGDKDIGKLTMNRFSLAAHHGDPISGTHYNVPGSSMEDMLLKLSASSPALQHLKKKSEDDALLDRWGGVDLTGLTAVARAISTFSGDAPEVAKTADKLAASAERKIADALPKLADKGKFLDHYRDLADRTQKAGGEIMLGDMDTYIRIADKFTKSFEDDEGKEHERVLVEGKGPLLIVDNHFGGLGHAIPLASLEKGELEIFMSHEDSRRGKLHIGADKKAIETPDVVMMHRVAKDLLEYLPATIDQKD